MVRAVAAPGLRLNEHVEADGPHRIRARLQDGARRHCVEAQELALPLRPLPGLAQEQEPGVRGGGARGGGGLGQMTEGESRT
jgi:hypothetical protein